MSPVRSGTPKLTDFAVLLPRAEAAPTTLALYLLSKVPFALLLPADLATQSYSPDLSPDFSHSDALAKFEKAGKITMLASQMIWIIANIPSCAPIETFSGELSTPVHLPSILAEGQTHSEPIPRAVEGWIEAQKEDSDFPALVDAVAHTAVRDGLTIVAEPDSVPKILVPPSLHAPLVRQVHENMYHLGAAKNCNRDQKNLFLAYTQGRHRPHPEGLSALRARKSPAGHCPLFVLRQTIRRP
jgi:hypothetical protein